MHYRKHAKLSHYSFVLTMCYRGGWQLAAHGLENNPVRSIVVQNRINTEAGDVYRYQWAQPWYFIVVLCWKQLASTSVGSLWFSDQKSPPPFMAIFGYDEPFYFSGEVALVPSTSCIFGGASTKGLGRAGLAVVAYSALKGVSCQTSPNSLRANRRPTALDSTLLLPTGGATMLGWSSFIKVRRRCLTRHPNIFIF